MVPRNHGQLLISSLFSFFLAVSLLSFFIFSLLLPLSLPHTLPSPFPLLIFFILSLSLLPLFISPYLGVSLSSYLLLNLFFSVTISDFEYTNRFAFQNLEFGVFNLEFDVFNLEFGVINLEFGAFNLEFGVFNPHLRQTLRL